MTRLCVFPALVVLLLPMAVFAGTNNNAKIAAHLQAIPTGKAPSVCNRAPYPPCNPGESNLLVQGEVGVGYDLYLLVLDGNPVAGVAGASFGINYGPNLSVSTWSLCATLDFPGGPTGVSWPQAGSGNVVTWSSDTNCQNTPAQGDSSDGVTAVLGAFYVYAYANESFEITPRNYVPNPDLLVADCSAQSLDISYPGHAGKASFGTADYGYDPCAESDTTAPGEIGLTQSNGAGSGLPGTYTLGSRSSTLVWTAPGDDGYEGGRVNRYDLRYLPHHLSDSRWNEAERVAILPVPRDPGEQQVVEVPNLPAGITYAFAIRSIDDAGNESPLSNVLLVVRRESDESNQVQPHTTIDALSGVRFSEPKWSPNGSQLMLKGTDGLYILDYPSAAPPRRIAELNAVKFAKTEWSPSGDALVYRQYPYGAKAKDEVVLQDLDLGTTKILASGYGNRYSWFKWTINGRIVIMDQQTSSDDNLILMDTQGRRVEQGSFPAEAFVWLKRESGEMRLWITDLSTGSSHSVSSRGWWSSPLVSPDGMHIAARTDAYGKYTSTVIIGVNGEVFQLLPHYFHASDWSSDGSLLFGWEEEYETDGHAEKVLTSDIAILNIQTREYNRLTTSDMLESHPNWSETNEKLAFSDERTGTVVIATLGGY